MTLRQKRDSIAGYALGFAIATIALIVASLIGMSQADASGFRQRTVCHVAAAPVVHHQAVVAAAIPYPVVGYQVGQHLQQQAVDEYGFRSSPSQQRLTYLEGYYEATQRLTDSGDRTAGPPLAPAGGEGQTTDEPQAFSAPLPPTAPDGAPQQPPAQGDIAAGFAATFPRWQAVCAGCHSGEEPKGDVDIANAVHQAFAEDSCEAREHFARLVADGEMPKGKKLDDAAKGALLLELYRSK